MKSHRKQVTTEIVQVNRPTDDMSLNIIIGTSHFIKTVEDIHEALVNTNPQIIFGLAFCEASGPRLIRTTGTDDAMIKLALTNVQKIAAGHSFVLVLKDTFPVNIMQALRSVPEIVNLFCATANPLQVIVAESKQGRGIIGVIDGGSPKGVESDKDVKDRKKFLRDIGYKVN